MADKQVTCIIKQHHQNPHEGITNLGGSGWRSTRQEVIASIEAKTNTYYTLVNNKRADVVVVDGASSKYVRTRADGTLNDNLLALPTCP